MGTEWEPDAYEIHRESATDESQEFFSQEMPTIFSPEGPTASDIASSSSTIEYHQRIYEFIESLSSDARIGNALQKNHRHLASEFAYSIPTEEVLDYLAAYDSIVELFAGNGYWAYECEKRGIDIDAYDADPPHDPWTQVKTGTENDLLHYRDQDIPLMMSWPPIGEAAYDALLIHSPSDVFFIGECPSNGSKMMANKQFWTLLEDKYTVETAITLPSFHPAQDNFYHFTKTVK